MKRAAIFLLLAFLLNKAFCAQAQTPDSVTLAFEEGKLIFPGNTVSMGLGFVSKSGGVARTRGLLDGKIPWRKLHVESSIDPRIRNGLLRIPPDLSLVREKTFTLRVYDRKKKRLYYQAAIPYHYPVHLKPQLPAGFTKAPGFHVPFRLSLQWNNGTTTEVNNRRANLISLGDFNYYVEGGQVSGNRLCISPDVDAFADHTVAMHAYAKNFTIPESDMVSFMLDYKARYTVAKSAWDGSGGSHGFSGHDGSLGGNGADGGWGTPGSDGAPGHDLEVAVDAHFDEILQATLVDVRVTDLFTGAHTRYRVNSEQGKVVVTSRGGDGGGGGHGGSGGNGGNGADGSVEKVRKKVNDSTYVEETIRHPGFPGGHGGNGGHGAPGGDGGNGGGIYVHHTEAALPYLYVLEAHSLAGSGGWGGSGGAAGSGGRGGSGEPGGRSGGGGSSGHGGPSGSDGRRGRVAYHPTGN